MTDGYRFGPFVLDSRRRTLTRDGALVTLTPKAFDLLHYLVQHPNRVLTRQDIMRAVWPDVLVEEGNLTQNIWLLRKALGDTGEQIIVTVPRQGYQFAEDVVVIDTTAPEGRGPLSAEMRLPPRSWPWRGIAAAAAALLVLASVAIRWLRSRSAETPRADVRLAVLPFANLTGDTTENYLADGLTEELITHLARLQPERLGVIARTSVMKYRGGGARLSEIGRDLGVGYALESSIRRSANQLRVTVQLVRVTDESHLWASDFDYGQQDVLHIEDSVAAAVAREVQLRLTPAQRNRFSRTPRTSARAVDAVLRGRDRLMAFRGADTWAQAKRYFDEAVALDSGYALAWAWLSSACRYGADREYMPQAEGYREARQAVARALALDSSLAEGWEQLGQLQRLVDWDWTAANVSYQRALELDPANVDFIARLAASTNDLGHFDETISLLRRGIELDPLDPGLMAQLSNALLESGHTSEALKTFESIPPELRDDIRDFRIDLLVVAGKFAEADSLLDLEPDPTLQLLGRAKVAARRGPRDTADSLRNAFTTAHHNDAAYQIAELFAAENEPDSALAWLDRAYAQRDQGLTSSKVDPLFASLRGNPRYSAFLSKMHLPQ